MRKIILTSSLKDDVYESLLNLLKNEKCPFPQCNNKASMAITYKNKWYTKPAFENSLIVCSEHAHKCLNGEFSYDTILTIRNLLKPCRSGVKSMSSEVLPTRNEYLLRVTKEIKNTTSLRCIYVGPLPLHPEWYFELSESKNNILSMDRAVSDALKDENIKVTIVFRNDLRYLDKVKSNLNSSQIKDLKTYVCNQFDIMSNSKYNNTFIFADTGIFHIPIITDNVCIFAQRSNANVPIQGALLVKDKQQIKWEEQAFDRIIQLHNNPKNLKTSLKRYLDKLDK